MRVQIEERFEGATLREVEQLYLFDDAFNQGVFEQMGYGRKLVTLTQGGGQLDRTLELFPERALPALFSSLVPRGVFHICEQLHYDFAQHRGSWRTIPSVLPKQLVAEGALSFEQTADAVVFRLHGDATAHLSLMSARAERQAVATAQAQHSALARAVRQQLDGSRRVTSYQVITA